MNNFFKPFLFLINIDSEMVLKWFGLDLEKLLVSSNLDFESSKDLSLNTFILLIEGLWEKLQDGLTLAEIESIIFFILFVRFVILAVRYNIKTSFLITCTGLVAGYLWYRHLIGLISVYRSVLLKIPFFNKLGIDAIQIRYLAKQALLSSYRTGADYRWYNFGKMLYYGFTKAITYVDPTSGIPYYIDPISMIVSNLPEPIKIQVIPYYYKIYNYFIPTVAQICSQYWDEISGICSYVFITRVGKKYCPYLIRWHWTFVVMLEFIEPALIKFMYRVSAFQSTVLIPKTQSIMEDPIAILQVNFLNALVVSIVSVHIGFVMFALLHAICGQYFYIPFLVENTELHIGPRDKYSIYSGGQTSWQDNKYKKGKNQKFIPFKFWYGWFGRGTDNNSQFWNILRKFIKKIFKKLRKFLRNKR